MSILGEFKAFISKGNVMDLAVGVIIGAAFKSVVDALVKDVITPIIGLFGGTPDFSRFVIGGHWSTEGGKPAFEGGILIGDFLNAVVSFLILAAVVFFLIVKPMNRLMATMSKPVPPPDTPAPPEDTLLLREIRDSLKKSAIP